MTELLLQRNKDLAKQRDKDGSTPLHYAASAPDPFFRFTVNVFSASNFERTSLGFYLVPSTFLTKAFQSRKLAILFPQFAVVLHLLLRVDPASAFQPDNQGSFPVHVAASAGCTVSLMILFTRYPGCAGMRNADGQTFLHVAVQKKRLGVVRFATRFMLGPGRQPLATSVVNAQDKNGDTALHLAVDAGELYMCRLLIMNRHTNINLRNMDGKTPMDIAAGRVESGFYFGLSATRRILTMLSFANALAGNNRRDQMQEYHPHLDEKAESDKIKDFAQIVGIGSVLVSTATFAAALAVPGGVWSPGDSGGKRLVAPPPAVALAGTPVLTGSYVFDGFVISNTLAFICSTLATFTLVYCGVAAVDIRKRFQMVSFSLILLLCSARSFCAAFTFASYLLLAKVAHGTAMASCVLTSLALLDGFMFLRSSLNDMLVIFWRRRTYSLLRYGPPFLLTNFLYPFWPYVVIGGYLLYDFLTGGKLHSPGRH
ncbi:hypothetical protein QOZ80_5AG0367640 [Eleusine coracana subsp. coracana]|nr:hypothetical protein QOZ80_5AG0367640 [Eleusine coracana subsp. coracana]